MCFVFLEYELQQDSYGWCIFNLKCQKTVERTFLETSKQHTKFSLMIFDLKVLLET